MGESVRHRTRRFARGCDHKVPRLDRAATGTDGRAREVSGKNLVCFCAPLPCHGDVLLDLVGRYGCDES
ncbi:DUF4326 domain-containing protein [Rhizobium sp. L43]|uniref:DUF4326 domain-containing protein n=1 Tax=Rhizobium sp. L43 TaxID=2035452 RepID=UPI0032AF3595